MKNTDFDHIIIKWARTNNLKNIDISLPKNKLITITWVSWSGKSTLAFWTIYKEWQFRYIESLSSYLRQFFSLWERPDVDYCQWFSPAIAIEQNKRVWNSRSTVWTLTEVDDYLRLLFSKLWTIHCHSCWDEIKAQTTDNIFNQIYSKFEDEKIYIIQDIWIYNNESELNKFIRKNRKQVDAWKGDIRLVIKLNNWDYIEYFYLEDPKIPENKFPIELHWIYDRITLNSENKSRLKEWIVKVLWKKNKVWIYLDWKTNWYTDKNFCPNCNLVFPDFTTQHFSANRQEGACEACHWLWQTLQVDFEKMIDLNSKYMEAILPWRDSWLWQSILDKLATKYWIDKNLQWKNIPEWFREVIMNWDDSLIRVAVWWKYLSMHYKWIESVITEQYNKWLLTVDFQAMLNMRTCPVCDWAKLKKESLNVFIYADKKNRYNLFELQNIKISELVNILNKYEKNNKNNNSLVSRIISPLIDRVSTITMLWLEHITLTRQIWSLSWWEIQRLRLAKQLWNRLTWIIYVLDEPTIWLDDTEIQKTIKAIKSLNEMWNTIVVVEHNEDFIKNSDWIVEIWPWAWDFWGEVVFNWTYKDFLKSDTLTSKYIRWDEKIKVNFNHKVSDLTVEIKKANKHNLKNLDVTFKLWSFTIITWPSWAWKTTLMYDIFYKFLQDKEKFVQWYIRLQLLKKWYSWSDIISKPVLKPDEYNHLENLALQEFFKEIWVDTIKWIENINNVLYVDQTSIWKTPRSCPATFIWVFDDIRKIFAWTTDAQMFWFDAWYFSFNSKKWSCTECDWYWHKKVELQFLPDTYIPCQLCNWKRYKSEILAMKWNWKNISDILDLYVKDALDFFEDIPFVKDKLQLMVDIWLWYLKMWQPAHTLSWWESQRLKLVKHLLKTYRWNTIYFLDEPTVWLHPYDIEKLLNVLKRFLDNWDSIFMIEHDKTLLKYADYVINLKNWELLK